LNPLRRPTFPGGKLDPSRPQAARSRRLYLRVPSCKMHLQGARGMLGRLILFFASAVVVACGAYFVAHDMASFCNATIRVDSLIGAGGLGVIWTAASIWDALTFWR
jgi:hypothetical protein